MPDTTDQSTLEKPLGSEQEFREEVEEKQDPGQQRKLFGTFSGVFTPTLLTILGVIMYLREGWVVGNAGLLGAWGIILLSFGITAFTALSLSSIVTNIRIGPGGAFSIISQSLGLEVGGSIGIPLYVSQALAVAMYVFGFRAGWQYIFPDHPAIIVDFAVFAILFGIGYISAGLAFKVQYGILAVIIGSLVSVGAAAWMGSMDQPVQWLGDYRGSPENNFQGVGFWVVFAVFFPASTGIMAGANMSGDLKDPRKSIPLGTLAAIAISLVVYLVLAWWLAASATTDELTSNYTVMLDKAAWGPLVLAGLLGATFSSALSSIVGAPRILQAMAERNIMPGSGWFKQRSQAGEPRNAMLFTGAIVLAALMLRNLNAIAPLITMFFLITYAMINIVVLLEQSLRLVSFRPLLRIPRFVSLGGAVGCVGVMLIVNPMMALVAACLVVALYVYLIRKHLKAPFGDVRSGLFVAVAEWAAKRLETMAGPREKTWKANILAPLESPSRLQNLYPLLRDIAKPKGFVRLMGLTGDYDYDEMMQALPDLSERFHDDGVFATWTVVRSASFSENLAAGLEALGGAFFRSNLIFLRLQPSMQRHEEIQRLVRDAAEYSLGVLILMDSDVMSRKPGTVHVVLDPPSHGWSIHTDLDRSDLALLTAYKLKRSWKADLMLTALEPDPGKHDAAREYLRTVVELARIPNTSLRVVDGMESLPPDEPPALTLFSIIPRLDYDEMERRVRAVGEPCLFALDSENENALV